MSPEVEQATADEKHSRGEVTFEEIAVRAYEIHSSGTGGDDAENWLRAEQQLNAEIDGDTDLHAEEDR